ncbi:MAG TPA: hypothetical protein VN226_08275 [Anaerolineales bacterium]|nr:hypothetical protein [Anaerolineales bacterium]
MDELVKILVTKVGLSEDQATQSVKVMVEFVKERVPAPYAGMIDGLLDGKLDANDLGSAMGLLGGLFGKK